ncbi:MAG: glutamate 5-kinase [Candidatus Puniceispirillaceae bacterium]
MTNLGLREAQNASALIDKAQRIVIKIGSALLFNPDQGGLQTSWLAGLAQDVAQLHKAGKQVILVSSGAIALGRDEMGIAKGRIRLDEKQAAAATGQIILAQAWNDSLKAHEITSSQILLAPDDTETRRKHLNARSTMQTLLNYGCVPVVNENDTITTYEIRFGDNDRLAARVAAMMSADLLILLSDIDGLYDKNPRRYDHANHVPVVSAITDDILAMGDSANAEFASGGMATKLAAARMATSAGVAMMICDGRTNRPLHALSQGAKSTIFTAMIAPSTARKNWIASTLDASGTVTIDDGAAIALSKGRSLLPAGVTDVRGHFERGDVIAICDKKGTIIAHGLSGYSDKEARLLKGQKSDQFDAIIGYDGRAELVHADDLVRLTKTESNKG